MTTSSLLTYTLCKYLIQLILRVYVNMTHVRVLIPRLFDPLNKCFNFLSDDSILTCSISFFLENAPRNLKSWSPFIRKSKLSLTLRMFEIIYFLNIKDNEFLMNRKMSDIMLNF